MADTASVLAAQPVLCANCRIAVHPGDPNARVEIWQVGDRFGSDFYHGPCWQEARSRYRGSPRATMMRAGEA